MRLFVFVNSKNRDSFSNLIPWLHTESMNCFLSRSFKSQLDTANFQPMAQLDFSKLLPHFLNTDFPAIPPSTPTKG